MHLGTHCRGEGGDNKMENGGEKEVSLKMKFSIPATEVM